MKGHQIESSFPDKTWIWSYYFKSYHDFLQIFIKSAIPCSSTRRSFRLHFVFFHGNQVFTMLWIPFLITIYVVKNILTHLQPNRGLLKIIHLPLLLQVWVTMEDNSSFWHTINLPPTIMFLRLSFMKVKVKICNKNNNNILCLFGFTQ